MYYNKTLYSSIKIKIWFNFLNGTVFGNLTSTSSLRKHHKFISQLQLHQLTDASKAVRFLQLGLNLPPKSQVQLWAWGGGKDTQNVNALFWTGTLMFCCYGDLGWPGILPLYLWAAEANLSSTIAKLALYHPRECLWQDHGIQSCPCMNLWLRYASGKQGRVT